jgi:hypothetical protein
MRGSEEDLLQAHLQRWQLQRGVLRHRMCRGLSTSAHQTLKTAQTRIPPAWLVQEGCAFLAMLKCRCGKLIHKVHPPKEQHLTAINIRLGRSITASQIAVDKSPSAIIASNAGRQNYCF